MLSLVDINNKKREDLLYDYYLNLIIIRTVYYAYFEKDIFASFVFEGRVITLTLLNNTFKAVIKSKRHDRYAFFSYNTVKSSVEHFHRGVKRFLDIMIRNKVVHKKDKNVRSNFHYLSQKCPCYRRFGRKPLGKPSG